MVVFLFARFGECIGKNDEEEEVICRERRTARVGYGSRQKRDKDSVKRE